ncbi:signal peptide peptidase SppA [bacterium]|nr:signal peptide peptidase SppA [bacterium]
MKQFFKFMFASFFGTILAMTIGTFLIIGIIGGISAALSSSEKEPTEITESTLFVPDLSKPIAERDLSNAFGNFNFGGEFGGKATQALPNVVASIEDAATNEHIKGMFLDLTVFQGGRASLEAIKNALVKFKVSGKPIYAYADYYNQATYYLAAVADSIFMQPTGELGFNGSAIEMMFFRGTFDKLDIEPRVIKHGKFKSAGEPFSEKKMSEYNKQQMRVLMHSVYTHYLAEVGKNRGIDSAVLRSIATELKIRTPQDAISLGMIDGLKYRDEVRDMLTRFMGAESYDDIKTMDVNDYMATMENEYVKDKIAVVYAVGAIGMGEGDDENIGSDRISKAIRDAREDDKVKAIVLRVNSPGGSALASDIILREVALCKEAGKPVVVSMGDVAASGGYYISCKADAIVAQPNTLTGSIGVIGIIPGTQKFFENKLGITFDRIKTGPFADLGNPNRDMSDMERKMIQDQLDRIYIDFISHVAEGRNLDTAFVNANGQGRVWTGTDALKLGLVDELGGLDRAIELAKEKAGLEAYQIKEFPKVKNPFEEIIKNLGGNVKEDMIKSEIGEEQYQLMQQIKWLTQFDEPMMLMPYFFKE